MRAASASPQQPTANVDVAGNVRVVSEVAGVAALFDDRCNVVVLKRTLETRLMEEAQHAARQPAFALITAVTPEVRGFRELSDRLVGAPTLALDIGFWTQVMSELTGCERVGVRLQRIDVAMCPRWHVDKVLVRMVSAFAGRGTEFVANRASAGRGAREPEAFDATRDAVIERAETGDLLFLKGEAWPGNGGRGALHRSPTATREQPRLVLTLDALW